MRTYIIKRLLLMIPTLLIVTLIVFFMSRMIPGDVVDLMLSEQQYVTEMDRAELEAALGLDKPIYEQYIVWLGNILRGDFGKSLWSDRTVISELALRWPVTVELGLLGIIVGLTISIPIGIYSAIRQDTIGDYIGRSIAIIFIAVPSFWLGTMVIVFPSIWWGWTPPIGFTPFIRDPLRNLAQFIIPSSILGMVLSGTVMRMTRTMMLEVLRQDYIRTAWSKGLRERAVILRHALKNALMPIVTIIGLQLPILVGGSVVLEQIFGLPGIGRLLIEIINVRDYTMLSGVNIAMAIFVLTINMLVDLSYSYLDPRVRYK